MISGRFNVVIDGQFGSTGKGKVVGALALRHRPTLLSSTNMANAGHTFVNDDGRKFVAKVLPSAAVVHAWTKDYRPNILLGPSAAFYPAQLIREVNECQIRGGYLFVHPRAGVMSERHRQIEAEIGSGPQNVASTMQGCGAFLAEKVMRDPRVTLARDCREICKWLWDGANGNMAIVVNAYLRSGLTILHEGSQGFSLDIHHGHSYPTCTSRQTTATQCLADMGIAPSLLGDVYMVIRPFPIRVGSTEQGSSGGCYADQEEITWDEVARRAAAPPEIAAGELTTVTKRLRRVFTFSRQQLREAAIINGATKIVLNFANYIDWACHGVNDWRYLPTKVIEFITMCEDLTGIPVEAVGTGPANGQMCWRP